MVSAKPDPNQDFDEVFKYFYSFYIGIQIQYITMLFSFRGGYQNIVREKSIYFYLLNYKEV